jgi:protein ImuB
MHAQPELRNKPVALSRMGRVPEVVVCSRLAARAGVRPEMPVAEARAIQPGIIVQEHEPDTDRRAIEELAQWADRFSPIVGLEEDPAAQCLLIDITGCASCFHGEDALLERAVGEFSKAGWVPRIAVADTVGVAWALAHYAPTPCLAATGDLEQPLQPLPPTALRLPSDLVQLLSRLGIERIDSLLALPRDEIPARFGSMVLQRLDQALGLRQEPILAHRSPRVIEASLALEYPTDRLDLLTCVIERLTQELEQALRARNCAARQVACSLYHLSKSPLHLKVGLFRPRQCPRYLGHLLSAQLEHVRFAEPIRAVRLRVLAAEPLIDQQTEFFATEPGGMEAASTLVDYLSSRLGTGAVTRACMVADFQPEYACRFEPLIQAKTERQKSPRQTLGSKRRQRRERRPDVPPFQPARPLCLWPRPMGIEVLSTVPDGPPFRMRWAGLDYGIVRSRGPERIETGWWRGRDVRRDYYVIDTDRGTRLWIFRRQKDGQWFLHGCFD